MNENEGLLRNHEDEDEDWSVRMAVFVASKRHFVFVFVTASRYLVFVIVIVAK